MSPDNVNFMLKLVDMSKWWVPVFRGNKMWLKCTTLCIQRRVPDVRHSASTKRCHTDMTHVPVCNIIPETNHSHTVHHPTTSKPSVAPNRFHPAPVLGGESALWADSNWNICQPVIMCTADLRLHQEWQRRTEHICTKSGSKKFLSF